MPAVIPLVAAGVGAAASVASSRSQSRAAQQAATASQNATDASLALQREQFDRVREDNRIGREAGQAATTRLSQLSGLTPNVDAEGNAMSTTDWLRSTPGYEANLAAGQRQQNASLASRGGLLSGDAGRAAIQYGQDYTNRIFNQERNALQSIAGMGQTATAAGSAAGAQQANSAQNALTRNADNLSSSYQARGNAMTNMFGGVAGAALYGLNNYNWGGNR
jgi:hypothetical protein